MNSKLVVILTILLPLTLFCQTEQWQNHTSMQNVRKIASDNNMIWAASEGGLFSYYLNDGSFSKFHKSEGLMGHNILAIDIDEDGKIWFGDRSGVVSIYEPTNGSFSHILDIKNSSKKNKRINDITIQGDTAFISTDFGISLLDINSLNFIDTFTKFGSFPSEIRVNSTFFHDNKIIVSTNDGIAIQKENASNLNIPDAWNSYSINNNLNINQVVSFENNLYAATESGIYKFENNEWIISKFDSRYITSLKIINGKLLAVIGNSIYDCSGESFENLYSISGITLQNLIYMNNQYFVASDKGIVKTDFINYDNYFPNGPASNSVVNISVADKGNVWIATGKNNQGKGVSVFDGKDWQTFSKSTNENITNNDYYNIYSAEDGLTYFLNWGKGITIFDGQNFQQYNSDNSGMMGIPNDANFLVIADAAEDESGNIWFTNYWAGNRKPLSVLTTDGMWHHYEFDRPLYPKVINTSKLLIDQFNNKWFISSGDEDEVKDIGLYKFNENGTFSDSSDDDLWDKISNADVSDIALDERGELWIGTDEGLSFIANLGSNDPIIYDAIGAAINLKNSTITSIAVDPLNRKWIGTTEGVYKFSEDCTKLLDFYDSENSDLPEDYILSIDIDASSGTVYFGTYSGITSLKTNAVQAKRSFDDIMVYPNPFVIDNNENSFVKIDGLVDNSRIKILSVSGNLIRDLSTPGGRIAYWDGRNNDGKLVSSGIYILVAFDEEADNVAKAKIAVLRK